MSRRRRLTIMRLLAVAIVVLISIYIFSIRDQARALGKYGYPGIFLFSILANGTVLLPAPGVLFVFAMGAVFHPAGVSVAAGVGAAVGELSGYLAGFSGQGMIENIDLYQRLTTWMRRNSIISYLTIMVLAFIPNPLFDVAGIAAGALRMPMGQFLFWCGIGKTLKMLMFAYAGAYSLDQIN